MLGVAANWLIFAWAITRLPRTDVALRGVRRAALLGAVGFEAIKQGAAVYFEVITGTPGGAVFGSLLGLLLFGYLVARLLLWVTAWAATARGNERIAAVPVPGPVVLRQEVVAGGASAGGLGAALLLGVAAGAWLRGRGRDDGLRRDRARPALDRRPARRPRRRPARRAEPVRGLEREGGGGPRRRGGHGGHPGFLRELLRQRGNGHTTNTVLARGSPSSRRPSWRPCCASAPTASSPRPSSARGGPLSDGLIHEGDMRVPLGLPHTPDPADVALALEFITTGRPVGFVPRGALRGLRLVATDLERAWGDGDELEGRAVDVLMAACGRTALLPSLSGAGVPVWRAGSRREGEEPPIRRERRGRGPGGPRRRPTTGPR